MGNKLNGWLRWWVPALFVIGLIGGGFVLRYRTNVHIADAAIHTSATEREVRDRDIAALKSMVCLLIEKEEIRSSDCPRTLTPITDP